MSEGGAPVSSDLRIRNFGLLTSAVNPPTTTSVISRIAGWTHMITRAVPPLIQNQSRHVIPTRPRRHSTSPVDSTHRGFWTCPVVATRRPFCRPRSYRFAQYLFACVPARAGPESAKPAVISAATKRSLESPPSHATHTYDTMRVSFPGPVGLMTNPGSENVPGPAGLSAPHMRR